VSLGLWCDGCVLSDFGCELVSRLSSWTRVAATAGLDDDWLSPSTPTPHDRTASNQVWCDNCEKTGTSLPPNDMVVLNEHQGFCSQRRRPGGHDYCQSQKETRANYAPNPYRVRPCLLSAYTTSKAVTVLRRACSV